MAAQADPTPVVEPRSRDPHEVAWQTLFFWMVCLAINSVSQPNGRVLGTSYRHQAILRGSPIFCAFDAIDTLASWVVYVVSSSTPFTIWNIRIAATRILLRRVVDRQGARDLGTIDKLVAQSRLRWVTFGVGVLPVVVKLYASKGIAWSQAIGTMYLASWLIFEVLLFSARVDDLAFQYIDTLPEYPNERRFREIWGWLAVYLHAALYSISSTPNNDGSTWRRLLDFLFLLSTFSLPLWVPCFTDSDTTPPDTLSPIMSAISAYPQHLLGPLVQFMPPLDHMTSSGNSDLHKALSRFQLWGVAGVALLGGLFHRRRQGITDTVRAVNLLLYPFFVYALVYEPAGTYQPLWFNWLG